MSPLPDEAQARAEAVVAGMLAEDAYTSWLGATVARIAPGQATVTMPVRAEMLNGFGTCHGGVTFALADSALAFASNTNGRVTYSIENNIMYPSPARAGDVLTAVAEEEHAGHRIATYRVTVTAQDGRAVAFFRGTVYRTSQEHRGTAS